MRNDTFLMLVAALGLFILIGLGLPTHDLTTGPPPVGAAAASFIPHDDIAAARPTGQAGTTDAGTPEAAVARARPKPHAASDIVVGARPGRDREDGDIVGALPEGADKDGARPPPAKGAEPPRARTALENALWGIPLSSLTAARQRPIFSPTRRPPSAAAAPVAPAKPAHLVPAQTPPRLALLGAFAGAKDGFAILLDETVPGIIRMKTGEAYAGWTLRDVKGREATLQRNNEIAVLELVPRK